MRVGDAAAQSRSETEGEFRQALQDFGIPGRLIEKRLTEPDPLEEKAGPTSPALWFLGGLKGSNSF
jgi:hypothetical protein